MFFEDRPELSHAASLLRQQPLAAALEADEIAAHSDDDLLRLDASLLAARAIYFKGNYTEAKERLVACESQAQTLQAKERMVYAALYAASCMLNLGARWEAVNHLNRWATTITELEGVGAAADNPHAELIANFHYAVADVRFDCCEVGSALAHARRARRFARHVGNRTLFASILLVMARCHARGGKREDALARASESLDLYEQESHQQGITYAKVELAFIHYCWGDLTTAVHLYETALVLAEDVDDLTLQARVLTLYALARVTEGSTSVATSLGEDALERAREKGSPVAQARAHRTLGSVALKLDQLSRAERHFARARELLQHCNHPEELAWLELSEGAMALQSTLREESLELLGSALGRFKKIGHVHGMARTHWKLFQLRSLLGTSHKAQEHFESALELYSSMGNSVAVAKLRKSVGLSEHPPDKNDSETRESSQAEPESCESRPYKESVTFAVASAILMSIFVVILPKLDASWEVYAVIAAAVTVPALLAFARMRRAYAYLYMSRALVLAFVCRTSVPVGILFVELALGNDATQSKGLVMLTNPPLSWWEALAWPLMFTASTQTDVALRRQPSSTPRQYDASLGLVAIVAIVAIVAVALVR